MIKIPFQDIVERIKKEANISQDEINQKINEKMKQLSGLISKEGAAHIIANEYGIKLLEATSGKLQIKNILTGMRDVETVGKVTRKFELKEFQSGDRHGKIASLVIADETGSIRVALWGNQADNILKLKEGAIVKIQGGYVRENNGRKEIHMNDRSNLIINPKNETIGEIKETATNAVRKEIKDLKESDILVEILGTIVQVFDLRFFEICPECGKRTKQEEDSFTCSQHGNIIPKFSYVLNLVMDDGTENIRSVFFRNQAEKLLNITQDKILEYKDAPEKFEDGKNELLGAMVKLEGTIKKNDFFDRLELIVQNVSINPDAEEEIKRLNEEVNKIEN